MTENRPNESSGAFIRPFTRWSYSPVHRFPSSPAAFIRRFTGSPVHRLVSFTGSPVHRFTSYRSASRICRILSSNAAAHASGRRASAVMPSDDSTFAPEEIPELSVRQLLQQRQQENAAFFRDCCVGKVAPPHGSCSMLTRHVRGSVQTPNDRQLGRSSRRTERRAEILNDRKGPGTPAVGESPPGRHSSR